MIFGATIVLTVIIKSNAKSCPFGIHYLKVLKNKHSEIKMSNKSYNILQAL